MVSVPHLECVGGEASVFVCILVPYIFLTNVCRSTYVSCQLCVVLFPFHSSPVQTLAHHQTCASVLTAPSPSSQPTPAALSAIFLFLLFIVSTFLNPSNIPFLQDFLAPVACSNVQLHRKPLFTNQLPQVKPAVTRSFFFLQIF